MRMRPNAPVVCGANDKDYLERSELHTEVSIDPSFTINFMIEDTFYGKCFSVSEDADFQPL